MVHLNGSALPEFQKNPDASSSNLFDDLRHINSLGDHRLRHHVPLDDQALVQHTPSPRRSRSSQTIRGPKPLLPRSLKEALQLAELLSKSKLIPKGFETPETCLVGILYGMEVGLSPIAALQRMAVIDGRPTIWGDAALALVQASGLLQSIKEEIVEDLSSESIKSLKAICTVRREGRSELIAGTFSIEDAKRAGLWQKPGPWTDYPKRMLIMRARAFALRDAFPDVLAGLYLREEFVGKERQAAHPEQDRSGDDAEWNALGANKDLAETKPSEVAIPGNEQNTESSSPQNAITEPIPDEHRQKNIRRAPPPPPATKENSDPVDVALTGPVKQVTPSRDIGTVAQPQYPVEAVDIDQSYATTEEPLDPETVLDLLDSALCCAFDLPTLEEIVDDFARRLNYLAKDDRKRAQKIIDRHNRRVEDLDRFAPSRTYGPQVTGGGIEEAKVIDVTKDTAGRGGTLLQTEVTDGDSVDVYRGAEDPVTSAADLPPGLKAFLPNLGLGALPMMARRRRRQNTPRYSLASWNARHRLRDLPPNHGIDEREASDQDEAQE